MKKYITVIGSRTITETEKTLLHRMAKMYHDLGYTLRSGGADGSDSVINKFNNVEIIIPWDGFNGHKHDGKRIFSLDKLPQQDKAWKTVLKVHPAPDKLQKGAIKLHTRNIYQITGINGVNRNELSELVIFVADETSKGTVSGGTRTAVTLARKLGIPTLNMRVKGGNK